MVLLHRAKYLMLYTIIRKRPKKTAKTSSPVPLLVVGTLVKGTLFLLLPYVSRSAFSKQIEHNFFH